MESVIEFVGANEKLYVVHKKRVEEVKLFYHVNENCVGVNGKYVGCLKLFFLIVKKLLRNIKLFWIVKKK